MTDTINRDIGLETSPIVDRPPIDKYYLLVIAVDQYTNGIPVLNNPVRDAENITTILTAKYRFETAQTWCLFNEAATWNAIDAQFKAINNKIGPNDALLIYCAGHGTIANSNYYFIPFDGIAGNRNSWYRVSDFYDSYSNYTQAKKCRDLLLVLDCCFAGAITLGFGQRVAEDFSRYVLTSCLSGQQASDGLYQTGSAFARSLQFVLDDNTFPNFRINKQQVDKKFQQYLKREPNKLHKQEISYTPLPMNAGEGEFVFELKNKETTPVDLLARTIITNLNFLDQKTDFITHYNEDGLEDAVIISTICKSLNVHKLQAKVLFEQMKIETQQPDLKFSSPIKIHPDMMNLSIWETLKRELQVKTDGDIKLLCTQSICDRLLVDNSEVAYNEPLIIYCGCQFQSASQSLEIITFCKELLEKIADIKKIPANSGRTYKKLLLFIADTREGNNPFIERDIMVQSVGPISKIVVARAVSDLRKGLAVSWLTRSKEIIIQEDFTKFTIESYFETSPSCDIESFIVKVSNDLGVDAIKLSEKLWNYA